MEVGDASVLNLAHSHHVGKESAEENRGITFFDSCADDAVQS